MEDVVFQVYSVFYTKPKKQRRKATIAMLKWAIKEYINTFKKEEIPVNVLTDEFIILNQQDTNMDKQRQKDILIDMMNDESEARMDIIGQNGNEGTHYDRLQVLYFSAPWCGPCKMFGPAFDETVAEFNDIDVKKINIDEDLEAARKYEVMSIPTVVLEKDGVTLFRAKGVMPKTQLKDLIEMHK